MKRSYISCLRVKSRFRRHLTRPITTLLQKEHDFLYSKFELHPSPPQDWKSMVAVLLVERKAERRNIFKTSESQTGLKWATIKKWRHQWLVIIRASSPIVHFPFIATDEDYKENVCKIFSYGLHSPIHVIFPSKRASTIFNHSLQRHISNHSG